MTRDRYLFWDDEIAAPSGRICQVGFALADLEGNRVGGPVGRLVDPECRFNPHMTAVHGIGPADVEGAPNFPALCEQEGILNLLAGCTFVSHNARSADLAHIRKTLEAYSIPMPEVEFVDTLQLARERGLPGRLGELCAALGVPLAGHHDALSDALACEAAFWKMGGGAAALYVPGRGTPLPEGQVAILGSPEWGYRVVRSGGRAYRLPPGYRAEYDAAGSGRIISPSGRPCGPHSGRYGGPCIRTERGGLAKLEEASPQEGVGDHGAR